MTTTIQRVPQGLTSVLGSFGGQNPTALADVVNGTMRLEQFYARAQYRSQAVVAGVTAPGGQSAFTTDVHAFLIAATCRFPVTSTMTLYRGSVRFFPRQAGTAGITLAEGGVSQFTAGADKSSTSVTVATFVPDTPFLLLPGNTIAAQVDQLGVDGTVASLTLEILIGSLG